MRRAPAESQTPTPSAKKAAAARQREQFKKSGTTTKHKGAKPSAAPAKRRRRRSASRRRAGRCGLGGGGGAGAGAAGSPRGLPERKVLGGGGGREVCAASALRRPPPPRSDKNAFSIVHEKKPQTNFPRTRRRFPQKSRSAAKFKTAHATRGGEECEQCPERKSELSVCLSASLSLSLFSVRGTARDVHEFGCRSLRLSGVLLISLFLLEALSEPGSVAFSIFTRRRVHLVCDLSFLSCSSI